jgi:putative membrane protein
MDMNDMGSGWGWAMMVLLTLVFLLLIGLIAWLAASNGRAPGSTDTAVGRSSARNILDERLARGEIDIDEYNRRLAALEARPPSR